MAWDIGVDWVNWAAVGGVESEEAAMASVDREVVRAVAAVFTVDAVNK